MMQLLARLRSLWRGVRGRSDVEAEMNEEFAVHVEMRAADLERSGHSHADALRQARSEFGSPARYKEEARASRGLRRIDEFRFSWLDFKLGFRMLVRYPGLTIVGSLAMALAIAVGAAAFEIVTQLVWPKLPFPQGDRIVSLFSWDAAANRKEPRLSYDLNTWRRDLKLVQDLGAYRTMRRNLITDQGTGAPVLVAEISASAFRVTSTSAMLGRELIGADERAGAPPVVVVGYDVWQTLFSGDSSLIGRSVRLDNMPATIVGVMPKGFAFPALHGVWIPLRLAAVQHEPGAGPAISIFGRLAPGVRLAEAQAELAVIGQRTSADFPNTHEHLRPHVMGWAQDRSPVQCSTVSWTNCLSLVRAGLYTSNLVFIVFLLLICANVALLMFARAAARESEIVMRSALGASRGRIVTQLVAEALVLGAVAAVIGIAMAGVALKVVLRLIALEGEVPFWWHASLSLPSIVYAGVLTILGATVVGALPALKVTRGLGTQLRQVAAGAGGLQFGGIWTVVIVAQIALSVFLTGLAVYSVQLTARIASFDLRLPAHEYLSVRLAMADSIPSNIMQELKHRLLSDPAVTDVTFAGVLPGGYHEALTVEVDGETVETTSGHRAQTVSVDADFFETVAAPVLAGRGFQSGEFENDRNVVVVNEAFVQRVLGDRNAIGRRVRFLVSRTATNTWGPWHEIIGVVRQVGMTANPEQTTAGVYFPLRPGAASVHMAVHLRSRPESYAARLRSIALATEPTLRLDQVRRLDGIKDQEVRWYSIVTRATFGACALVLMLSLAGIYSIMSFTVSRRTREIGIRVALGADRRQLVGSILARSLAKVGSGIVIGVALFVFAAGGIKSLKVGLIVLAFTIVMTGVCILACIVPARRALAVQPTEALRAES